MKKFIYAGFLLFASSVVLGASGGSPPPLNIRSENGAVTTYPYQAKFPNGSVTDNGDGTVSITNTGVTSATNTFTGSNTFTNPVTFNSSATFKANVGILGNLNQPLTATSSVTVTGNFGVTGNVSSPLTVTSSATVTGNFGVTGNVSSPMTITSSLTVTGTSVNFTTVTFSNYATGGILGTGTSNAANPGMVGQSISSDVGTTTIDTTVVGQDLTSISLTAGDWDVSGRIGYSRANATWSQVVIYISSGVAGNDLGTSNDYNFGYEQWLDSLATPVAAFLDISNVRLSLASTVTVYLKARATFSAGQPSAHGSITARRIR